jgi:hypothetical protein
MTLRRVEVPFTRYQIELRTGEQNGLGPSTAWPTNVGTAERVLSAVAGVLLVLWGLRRALPALPFLLIGGYLLYRGASGSCPLYHQLGRGQAGQQAHELAPATPDSDDRVDETGADSFPASDPPAFNA